MDTLFLFRFLIISLLCLVAVNSASGARAVLLESADAAWSASVRSHLEEAGIAVSSVEREGLTEAIAGNPDVLVLPDARRFPASALDPLTHYLKEGGCLTAVGAPAFDTLLVHSEGQWISLAEAAEKTAEKPPAKLLFEFKAGDEHNWARSTNHPEFDERLSIRDGALAGFVSRLDGWNTYQSPVIEGQVPTHFDLTVLEARGDQHTPRLYVEWRETDGSRWIADLRVTEKWKRYVLSASDFNYWSDNDSVGRGGPGDRLNLRNAKTLCIGLAENFGVLPPGEHLWWVRNIGVASALPEQNIQQPKLQTLSPSYKLYKMDGVRRMSARSDQAVIPESFTLTGDLHGWMPIWRSRGVGYEESGLPHARFIPVVDAYDDHGQWRGTAAWYYLHFSDEYEGGIWAGIGVNVESLTPEQRRQIAQLTAHLTARMFSGPLLRAAGVGEFALGASGGLSPGACVRAFNSSPSHLSIQTMLLQEGTERPLASGDLSIAGHSEGKWQSSDVPYTLTSGPARLKTVLLSGGRPIDIISQALSVSGDNPKDFVQAHGGQFTYRGRPFFANGVNYFPRYITGTEPREFQHSWLGPGRYDPEIIERDLGVLQALRVNVVSIQYLRPGDGPQLVDFLERCRLHHIFVNIFFEGANPLSPNLDLVKKMVSTPGLKDNPQVFAYDLAWEPNLGRQDQRRRFDSQWTEWVEEQYGSLARAQNDWGFSSGSPAAGVLSSPTDDQLITDGPWQKMVAAYRRFVDDMVSRGYGQITRLIRSLDPNHMLGARTGYGGTGQMAIAAAMPLDLASGAAHLDFISPEGYGIVGELDNYLAGGFTTEYARFVSGGKPVFWAEYGQSVWPDTDDPDTLARQALHFERSYDLFTRSHANGSAAWWFPSGLRVDENSDYGIVRQDGQPRPAGQVIQHWSGKADKALALPAADGAIVIDRDRFVSGYAGVWAEARDNYLAGLKKGRRLVCKTAGTGTDSRCCPAIAVGGTPWTKDNPPKYLNAEISDVQVQAADGSWQDGLHGVVDVRTGQPVKFRVTLTNSGEATWLAGEETGSVVVGYTNAHNSGSKPLSADVPALKESAVQELSIEGLIESELALRMLCVDRGPFGQRVRVHLHFVD